MGKNKNKKRSIIAMVLAITATVASSASVVVACGFLPGFKGEKSESLAFQRIDGKDEYRVIGLGTVSTLDIEIPSKYNGMPVTEIGTWAFANPIRFVDVEADNTDFEIDYFISIPNYLKSITIPDSVTLIDDYAFLSCTNLTSVVIGDSVTTIGEGAFAHCSSLENLVIGDSVTSIGSGAFSSCDSLTSVEIPDSVTSIGDSAFVWCDSLTSVEIGDSVTTIGNEAFAGCSSLTSVVIPDSVTSIGNGAFWGCLKLTSATFKNTSGWKYASSITSTYWYSIPSTLANKSTAAEYLRNTYSGYYWKKD